MVPEERTVSSAVVYEGRAFRVRVDTVETATGRKTTRDIVEHADCIAVIAIDGEGNILLVNQFRKPVEEELLEIPAGGIDAGEEPPDAVRREMQEETGHLPRRVEPMGGFYSTPGYSSEYLYLYLATDLVPSPLTAEDTEGIEVVRVRPGEVPDLIAEGKIRDAKSIAGLLYFLDFQQAES
jgi:ADP-ribose pyrophosphatase